MPESSLISDLESVTSTYEQLAAGIDPEVSQRVRGMLALAREEIDKSGVKIPEGSLVRHEEGQNSTDQMSVTGPYEKKLTVATMKKMMEDPDVSLGHAALTGPIIGAEYAVECESEEVKIYDEAILKRIWRHLIASSADAIPYGFQGFEKCYTRDDIEVSSGSDDGSKKILQGAVIYEELYDLDPESVKIQMEGGYVKGLEVGKVFLPLDMTGNTIDKGALITLPRVQWGNYSGKPQLATVYYPWYAKSVLTQFFLRYVERLGDPPLEGRYPKGETKSNKTGTAVNNATIMMDLLRSIRSHGSVALENTRISDEDKEFAWQIKVLEHQFGTAPWLEAFEHFSVLIYRGWFQPEKRVIEAKGVGTYGSLEILDNLAEMIAKGLFVSILEQLSIQVLRPINLAQFGPKAPKARIIPGAMSRLGIDLMRTVLQWIVEYEKGQVPERPIATLIDRIKILETLGLPVSHEEIPPVFKDMRPKPGQENQSETPPEDQGEEIPPGGLSLSGGDVRRKYAAIIRKKASEWKRGIADPILKDQISSVADQITKAWATGNEAAILKAIDAIEIPTKAHSKALEGFLTDMYDLGKQSVAEELGIVKAAISPAEMAYIKSLASGLAQDRAGALWKQTHVAGLNGVKWGQKSEEVLYELRKRAEEMLGDRSNLTTSVAEAWRGYSDGRMGGLTGADREDDPIVAAVFHLDPSVEQHCEFCEALDGEVIEADDPRWFALHPPHHHGCPCQMEYLRASQVEGKKIPRLTMPPQDVIEKADPYFVPKELL